MAITAFQTVDPAGPETPPFATDTMDVPPPASPGGELEDELYVPILEAPPLATELRLPPPQPLDRSARLFNEFPPETPTTRKIGNAGIASVAVGSSLLVTGGLFLANGLIKIDGASFYSRSLREETLDQGNAMTSAGAALLAVGGVIYFTGVAFFIVHKKRMDKGK